MREGHLSCILGLVEVVDLGEGWVQVVLEAAAAEDGGEDGGEDEDGGEHRGRCAFKYIWW